MQSQSRSFRRAQVFTAAALACLLIAHLVAAYKTLDQDSTLRNGLAVHDETQYLHAGWLLAQGQHLYGDFFDDHSPFLFVILKWLVPSGGTPSMPLLDVRSYIARARTVTSICGVIALTAIGFFAYRGTRSLFAALVAIAALLASPGIWHGALTDVRNDPPGLMLFWIGALFLIAPWRSERTRLALAGVGIGLAFAAALWNPKMPFECAVLGAVYLWRLREAARAGMRMVGLATAGAIAIPVVTVLLIASTVSIGDYIFFTFELNRIIGDFYATNKLLSHGFSGSPAARAFLYCDPAFKGPAPLLAMAIACTLLAVPRMRRAIRDLDFRAYGLVLALAIAALLDIRFLFSYPNIFPQYLYMGQFAVALLYGMTAAAVLGAIPHVRMTAYVQIVAAAFAVLLVLQTLPRAGASSWFSVSYMQKRLRPNETVWLSAQVHPIAAKDASYYWFAFELARMSGEYSRRHPERSRLPIVREQDLPVCRAERGLDPNLRFVSGPEALILLPDASACLHRLVESGRAVRTPIRDVWDLHPPPRGQ